MLDENLPENGHLSPNVGSVKMGGPDNHAYAGVPQGDDPSVLDKVGKSDYDEDTRTHIAGYLEGVWELAKRSREANGIETDLLNCLRQFKGEYDANEASELTMRGYPLVYFPLSEHKVHTAVAWIDEFFTNGESLVNIRPTPMPEMENDVVATTTGRVMKMSLQAAMSTGEPMNPDMARKAAELMRPMVERELQEEARTRSLRMERVLHDDMIQGGWSSAIHDLIGYTSIYGTAGFRSPVIRVKKELVWNKGKLQKKDRVIRGFEAVSPFDIFPSPGMTDTQNGDLCVRVRYQPHELSSMKKQPLWIKDEIDAVLEMYGVGGVRLDVSSDSERTDLTNQDSTTDAENVLEGFEFWGGASGSMLREIGIDRDPHGGKIEDSLIEWYQINAVCIGGHVVFCRVMRDVEERPIDVVKFYDTPGSFWGRGPLQLIASLQRICNAAGRSIVINMGYSAGPQAIFDISQLDPRDDLKLRPCKGWVVKRNGMNQASGKPVEFFQVDSNAKTLSEVFEFFQRLADEVTGIPAYANGTDAATGAARTATGLNMLFGAANRGIKKVIGNFDELVKKEINRLFMWHMEFNDDDSIKGDVKVEVTGLKYFVTKTAQANDRLALLSRITQDQRMAELQTPDELAKMMREIAIAMDLPPDALAPDADELNRRREEARQQQIIAQQQQAAAAQQAQDAKIEQINAEASANAEAAPGEGELTPTGRPDYPDRPPADGGQQ